VPAPPALRPYLAFHRLTPRSLEMVARVVDADDEFRARVATQVSEDEVGRAGRLWLERPEGWAEELAELESAWATERADKAGARDERAATRKLAAVHEALARAEAEAAQREAALVAARDELASERTARTRAEQRVTELEADVAAATSDRAEVVRNLKTTEARAVARATELKSARARVRELEDLLAALGAPPERPVDTPVRSRPAATPSAEPRPPADEADVRASGLAGGEPVAPRADPGALAGEVAKAADGAAALAASLGRLAALLAAPGSAAATGDPDDHGSEGAPPTSRVATADGGGSGPATACVSDVADPVDAAGPAARRVPVALPGGVFDDSAEAAEHLLRTPGIVLVVDGYNVSMQGWPDLPVAEQRRRLVTALADLAARTATHVEVVFDGAEVEPMSLPALHRQLLRVRFSAPDVEADDVAIDLVASIPAVTPVAVASSDRRVRDGVRRRGANLLHAAQLLTLLGR
jgi:predicted RNA-binding protein with PIN domain